MDKLDSVMDAIHTLADDCFKLNKRMDAANTTKEAASAKIQSASKEQLHAALKNPNTDPKIKKMIEKELDDRASRGA